VSKVIKHVQSKPDGANIPANIIATALALICGIIVTGIGLLRLGWIVEVGWRFPDQSSSTWR
jgi:sodium-independent sulfate anion transporter 11